MSSQKQGREGNGLDSQEAKCRTWCKFRNLNVLRVVREEGISGGEKNRPALMRMFSFLEEISKKGVRCIVLVEDLNRWSRETVNHFMLKQTITSLGHSLQSVNMSLDDSEESKLMETLSASVSRYERKKN
ncbi:MAG: recombinase family protein [Alphaproteobacteria bacterium]|nr:recombinase family protein [Alphaproteobacteria bacterium]